MAVVVVVEKPPFKSFNSNKSFNAVASLAEKQAERLKSRERSPDVDRLNG